jgi:hypothetical protein
MTLIERGIDGIDILEREIYTKAEIDLLRLSLKMLANHRFAVIAEGRGMARLLNLLCWDAASGTEFLDDQEMPADQAIHMAIHQVIERDLGSTTPEHMLLAETIASASDLYLLGKLAKAGEETAFVTETMESFSFYYETYAAKAEHLETLLQAVLTSPFMAMSQVADFLFETGLLLFQPLSNAEALRACTAHAFYPLIHHYNITNWIMAIRERHPDPRPTENPLSPSRFMNGEERFLGRFG